jgi:ADP-dependent NAD(P)H-hydrate dehydratase / NAD(P)H-hydrate epimerase
LLHRKPDAHKGDFGHILVLAGSLRFSGAAVLTSNAAIRCGAGLVTLGIPKSLTQAIIKNKAKEVMVLPLPQTKEATLSLSGYKKINDFSDSVDILAVGPGLSGNKSTQMLARRVVSKINKPMVIDADGLNALVGNLDLLKGKVEAARIITPHPGEMARLLGISIEKVQADRRGIAAKFSRDYKVTVVLKGCNTVVADPGGNLYINKTGNPGMASAGCGDVLTGIIAAFLAQGLNAFEASKFAAYIHGLSGDLAAKEKTQISLIASDIIDKIPEAIRVSSKVK